MRLQTASLVGIIAAVIGWSQSTPGPTAVSASYTAAVYQRLPAKMSPLAIVSESPEIIVSTQFAQIVLANEMPALEALDPLIIVEHWKDSHDAVDVAAIVELARLDLQNGRTDVALHRFEKIISTGSASPALMAAYEALLRFAGLDRGGDIPVVPTPAIAVAAR